MSTALKAHLALFTVALLYGANYSIAKIAMDGEHIQPLAFILLRVFAGLIMFWIFHFIFLHERVAKRIFGYLFCVVYLVWPLIKCSFLVALN